MKIKELSNLSVEDLVVKEKQLKKDLFEMESHRQMGRVEKPASFRNLRRDIARILTVQSQKKEPLKNSNTKEQRKVNGKRK